MAPACAVWFWGKRRLPLSKKQRELSPGPAGGGLQCTITPQTPPNPAQDPSPRRDPVLAPAAAGWSLAQSWDLIPGLRQPPRYPQTKGNSSSGWNRVK